MKYLWASLGNNTDVQIQSPEKLNSIKTRHIRGYGRAVTFSSSTNMKWSSAQATYSFENKTFESCFCRG